MSIRGIIRIAIKPVWMWSNLKEFRNEYTVWHIYSSGGVARSSKSDGFVARAVHEWPGLLRTAGLRPHVT